MKLWNYLPYLQLTIGSGKPPFLSLKKQVTELNRLLKTFLKIKSCFSRQIAALSAHLSPTSRTQHLFYSRRTWRLPLEMYFSHCRSAGPVLIGPIPYTVSPWGLGLYHSHSMLRPHTWKALPIGVFLDVSDGHLIQTKWLTCQESETSYWL